MLSHVGVLLLTLWCQEPPDCCLCYQYNVQKCGQCATHPVYVCTVVSEKGIHCAWQATQATLTGQAGQAGQAGRRAAIPAQVCGRGASTTNETGRSVGDCAMGAPPQWMVSDGGAGCRPVELRHRKPAPPSTAPTRSLDNSLCSSTGAAQPCATKGCYTARDRCQRSTSSVYTGGFRGTMGRRNYDGHTKSQARSLIRITSGLCAATLT